MLAIRVLTALMCGTLPPVAHAAITSQGEMVFAKGKWLIPRDTVGNIERIRETLKGPGQARSPSPDARRGAQEPAGEGAKEKAPRKLAVIAVPGLNPEVVPEFKKLIPPDVGIARFPSSMQFLFGVPMRTSRGFARRSDRCDRLTASSGPSFGPKDASGHRLSPPA